MCMRPCYRTWGIVRARPYKEVVAPAKKSAKKTARHSGVPLSIAASCEECDRAARIRGMTPPPRPTQYVPERDESARGCILVEMSPGPDGQSWYLCVPHWFDGLHPNDLRTLGSGRVLEVEAPT